MLGPGGVFLFSLEEKQEVNVVFSPVTQYLMEKIIVGMAGLHFTGGQTEIQQSQASLESHSSGGT